MRGINKHPDSESPQEAVLRRMFVPAFITKTPKNLQELEFDVILIVEEFPQSEYVTLEQISTEDDNKK